MLDAGVQLRRDESLTHIGATHGWLEIIKLGIARGDDINVVGDRGYTPLLSAITNRQIAAIEFLLANGAVPTDVDNDNIARKSAALGPPRTRGPCHGDMGDKGGTHAAFVCAFVCG